MKRTWLLIPAFLIAGVIMLGCPSEPEKTRTIDTDDGDTEAPVLTFAGGTFQFLFDTPRIEDQKEYRVTLTIVDCDDDFVGSRLGGKISYKMDLDGNDEKILAGWLNSVPPTVADPADGAKKYRWAFKAGSKHSDDKPIESPATTPEGGKQFFALTAQNGYDNYSADASFNVKTKFEVELWETITEWVSAGTVTLGNDENTAGKGALTEEDMIKIRALVAQYPRSQIEFTVKVTVNTGNARPGYGVCGVGGWEAENSISISVPGDAQQGEQTFTARIDIADLLELQPAGYQIAVNPYNGATVTKAELFRPGP